MTLFPRSKNCRIARFLDFQVDVYYHHVCGRSESFILKGADPLHEEVACSNIATGNELILIVKIPIKISFRVTDDECVHVGCLFMVPEEAVDAEIVVNAAIC